MHSKEIIRAAKLAPVSQIMLSFGGKRRFTLEETNINQRLN